MGHVFHQLYYHFAWATHARDPHIHPSIRAEVLRIVNEEAKNRGGWPIRHNAMIEHVHLLVRLPPTSCIADFIGQVKGATAHRVNEEVKPKFKLRWQEGYGVLTLRGEEVEKVARYIDDQERHHASGRLSRLLETTEGSDDLPASEMAP